MSNYTLKKNSKFAVPGYDLVHAKRGILGSYFRDSRLGTWEFESADGTISTQEEASAIARAFSKVPVLFKSNKLISKL